MTGKGLSKGRGQWDGEGSVQEGLSRGRGEENGPLQGGRVSHK